MPLQDKPVKISASILSADFSILGEEVSKISASGADYIHVDVMDGHFVPNITIGPQVVKQVKKYSSIPLDVHLMINNVEKYIDAFVEAGADMITFHYEAVGDSSLDLIRYIKSLGVRVGISIIPSTSADSIKNLISEVDLVLVMTVSPGYGGQKFLYSQIDKIIAIRELIKQTGNKIELSVDGGIDNKTAKLCIDAGANVLVSGSYIFHNSYKNYQKNIEELAG